MFKESLDIPLFLIKKMKKCDGKLYSDNKHGIIKGNSDCVYGDGKKLSGQLSRTHRVSSLIPSPFH